MACSVQRDLKLLIQKNVNISLYYDIKIILYLFWILEESTFREGWLYGPACRTKVSRNAVLLLSSVFQRCRQVFLNSEYPSLDLCCQIDFQPRFYL